MSRDILYEWLKSGEHMARCGYTLQRSRKKVPFKNMDDDIARFRREMDEKFSSILSAK
ncbi:hypothetical protein [Mixta calida]|uniref:hypothetical protein n=1 Tax=Mixta calida TaxID=665913 RepID=UPI002FDE0742